MEHSGAGNEFDVIVVGAGVMGSSTAYNVAKRGHKTLLLEQFDFLHHRGSSHGESRTIRATYSKPYYHPMVLESYNLWEQAQSEIGYKVYFKAHQLNIGPTNHTTLNALVDNCRRFSDQYQILDRRQLADKYSGRISIPESWAGLCTELGGVLKPTKAVSMFQTLAGQNGAVLKDRMEVIKIVKNESGGVCVFTAGGEKFNGKKCVVTVGSWMSKLVKAVSGIELPLQPLETTACYWRIKEGHEAEFGIGGDFPTFSSLGETGIFGTPAMEFPGLIKICSHEGHPCDPDKRPWGPAVSLDSIKEWIRDTFSGMVDAGGPVITQQCMYTVTPDEDYVIDFLGGEFDKDVVIAGGFSGHGFKNAPAVGRILGDLALTGEAKGVDLKYFRMSRFQDNPKGNIKETAGHDVNKSQ